MRCIILLALLGVSTTLVRGESIGKLFVDGEAVTRTKQENINVLDIPKNIAALFGIPINGATTVSHFADVFSSAKIVIFAVVFGASDDGAFASDKSHAYAITGDSMNLRNVPKEVCNIALTYGGPVKIKSSCKFRPETHFLQANHPLPEKADFVALESYQRHFWPISFRTSNPEDTVLIKKSLAEALKKAQSLHKDAILITAPVKTSSFPSLPISSRRLQDDPTTAVSDGPIANAPTVEEIESYQIILWTSVLLVVILFSAICSLSNMNVGRDSLLYAKFQTEASHRKND